MRLPIRKIFITISINFCFFIILVLGIQNSNIKNKIKFLENETIKLPLSFIVGIAFIGGSITGSLLPLKLMLKNKE